MTGFDVCLEVVLLLRGWSSTLDDCRRSEARGCEEGEEMHDGVVLSWWMMEFVDERFDARG